MNTKINSNKVKIAVSAVSGAALLFTSMISFVPFVANAQTTTATTSTTQTTAQARLTKMIAKGDADIAARLTSLNNLTTRVQALKNVSADEKASLASEIQTNVTGLTSLKAKIDADTDITTATNDDKAIFGSYRIYALVIPRGYIVASSDRVNTVGGMLSAVGTKLQARITVGQTSGKNVTALQTSLADMNAKIADAQAQATAAHTVTASLTPDQGDKTKLASNTAALKTARADIKVATKDLETARADAKTIIQGLKTLNIKAGVSASSTTLVQ